MPTILFALEAICRVRIKKKLKINCEKDLRILISNDLRWKNHINAIAAKANRVLGMLLKTFTSRDMNLWKLLYVSLVRPHLEFASTVWNPYLAGDIETLEKVQRRATRIPPEMRSFEYEDRLTMWGLTSLRERRVRGDLIQMYKVRNNIENINWQVGPLDAPHTNTRGESHNNLRLRAENFSARIRNDFRHFVTVREEFFLNRAVDGWNRLASSQITAPSVNSFKSRIDI